MPHPIMFSERDPVLQKVRKIALAFPEASEKVAHGRPTFRCGKMFAVYGGGTKKTATEPHRQINTSVLFIVDPAERAALEHDRRIFLPAYMAGAGWLGLDLSIDTPEWDEVAELLDASYRQIAPKRAIALLDTQ